MKIHFALISCLMLSILIKAQTNAPLNHSYYSYLEKDMHDIGVFNHTSLKPFLISLDDTAFYRSFKPIKSNKSFIYSFLNGNLLEVKDSDFNFSINPLFHFELGQDNKKRFVNSRGIEVKGRIGQKLYFYSTFHENQMTLSDYINSYVKSNENVVPGQGMAKYYPLMENDILDFYYANGYVNYDINKFFDVQLGHGKHFLGDGYRSMLLSDNSFNYPYFKITTDVWKIKYVNLYSFYQDIDFRFGVDDISKYKFSATHYLSANLGRRLNIGLFESVILSEDSLGSVFDINYVNPIIFYRPVEYSISYSRLGNSLMGLSFKYKLSSLSHLYGQILLDEFRLKDILDHNGSWLNKYGGQIGLKYFDVFGFKNFNIQSELNFAQPYTYSHFNPTKNYAHFAQPLAHPLGASFLENVSILRYFKDRWVVNLKLIFSKHGAEISGDSTNYGSDIFQSYYNNNIEFGNYIAQGNTTRSKHVDFRVGYIINPRTNMKLEVGINSRDSKSFTSAEKLKYFFFSFKTDLQNFYYDF